MSIQSITSEAFDVAHDIKNATMDVLPEFLFTSATLGFTIFYFALAGYTGNSYLESNKDFIEDSNQRHEFLSTLDSYYIPIQENMLNRVSNTLGIEDKNKAMGFLFTIPVIFLGLAAGACLATKWVNAICEARNIRQINAN